MPFSDNEIATSFFERVELPSYDDPSEVELFLENCSSLYGLILDALHDLDSKTLTWPSLEKMASGVVEVGRRVAVDHPDAERTIALRINTINSAMEQLKLRRYTTSDTESCSSRSQCSVEVRSWIHNMERRLNEHEHILRQSSNHAHLAKLMSDHQALQKEIQTEGQALVNRLFFQLSSEVDPETSGKKKSSVEAIRKRWHTVYLNSLSLLFRIEDVLNSRQDDSDSDADSELLAPPTKRARRVTLDEDTLPFAESEYESIMDGRTTVLSISSEEAPAVVCRKWDSQQHDIGYSSGENSAHDTNSADFIPPTSSEHSPFRALYRVVPDDPSEIDVRKALESKREPNPLSDSMHVQYDQDSFALPDFDEVMALLDSDHVVPHRASNESFNTQWKEIRAGGQAVRRSRGDGQCDEAAKNSCDASSEDSSDWEGSAIDAHDLMSKSFHSSMLGSTHSLKRHRTGRKHSQYALETSEMEASFCSTRSDLPPCLGRSMRKRLRVRRMPRSMSDGEQLGIKAGVLTPQIRVSPPQTPLSSSTRLLQQLDRDLQESHSDTAPEQSDAPAYEWDEYNPPAKDDCVPDGTVMYSSNDLPIMDDDFADHFGADANSHLLNESRMQHRMVVKFLEASDAETKITGELDSKLATDIALICRKNRRQLEEAIRLTSAGTDVSDLKIVKEGWDRLLNQVLHPTSRILTQFEHFVKSFRELHERLLVTEVNLSKLRTLEDVRSVMETMMSIEHQLTSKREILRQFVRSDALSVELAEVYAELQNILKEYDDDVEKIRDVVDAVRRLHGDWNSWNSLQNSIRLDMSRIEEMLSSPTMNQEAVHEQMRLCEERMDRLETTCNHLIVSLEKVQEGNTPNFRGEISVYSNAMEQFKLRLSELVRVPTPPTMLHPLATSTPCKSSKKNCETQTTPQRQVTPAPPKPEPVRRTSWVTRSLLALSFLCVILALLLAGVFNHRFGPHLTYVNGPPPV